MSCSLVIQELELSVKIGVGQAERSNPQSIFLDVEVHFMQIAKSCLSDDIEDTVCYDEMINKIIDFVDNQIVNTIERLAYMILHLLLDIYKDLKPSITLRVSKSPIIRSQRRRISFSISSQ